MNVFVLGSYVQAHSLFMPQLPSVGTSVTAERLWIEHGGKGLNLAVAMHRLGLPTQTLIAVRNDPAGQALCDYLHHENMNSEGVITLPVLSGFGVGLVSATGENVIAVYSGANSHLTTQHVQTAQPAIMAASLVCAQLEIPDAVITEAFVLAHQAKACTLLMPSPWRVISPELWQLSDIVVMNEPEAMQFFNCTDALEHTIADWFARLGMLNKHPYWQGRWLVITLAERGCVAWEVQNIHHCHAYTITAQDPTGAGDAFTAGLAWAWMQGYTLTQALPIANACGAMVAAQQGVLPILPTLPQLQAFLSINQLAD